MRFTFSAPGFRILFHATCPAFARVGFLWSFVCFARSFAVAAVPPPRPPCCRRSLPPGHSRAPRPIIPGPSRRSSVIPATSPAIHPKASAGLPTASSPPGSTKTATSSRSSLPTPNPKSSSPTDKISALLNAAIPERDRDHRARYDQPDYIWAPDSQHILFDTNGALWLFTPQNRHRRPDRQLRRDVRRRSQILAQRPVRLVPARQQSLRPASRRLRAAPRPHHHPRPHRAQRRRRLGLPRRARRPQQLLLVARLARRSPTSR